MDELNTELKILAAAEQEFFAKGLAGARMQEIADRAGINKALLHYYYRSKEKLFMVVFKQAVKTIIPKFFNVLNNEMPLFDKIDAFINNYLKIISAHPHIPSFILHELNHHPNSIATLFPDFDFREFNFYKQVNEAVKNKEIIEISPEQLFLNIISLCVFPFVARPIFENVILRHSALDYDSEIAKRGKLVSEFVIRAIKIEQN